MFIFLFYNCNDPDCEIQKKTHLHVWKCKQQEFLVLPLRPAHVLTDDCIFLIMDIVIVTRMAVAMRTYCWQNDDVELTPVLNDILRDHIVTTL